MSAASLIYARCALALGAFCAWVPASERWTQFSTFTDFTGVADDGEHIWIGTRGGLIRFGKTPGDTGYFNQTNSPLTDTRIRNLASDGKGRTAAVTYGGCLAVFENAAWDAPGAFAALRGQSALDAAWDRPGSLWVLTADDRTGRLSVFHRRDAGWDRTRLDSLDSISIWKGDFSAIIYSDYSNTRDFPRLQTDTLGRAWVIARSHYRPKAFRIGPDGSTEAVAIPDSLIPMQLFVSPSGEASWLCSRVIARPAPAGWEVDSLPGMYSSGAAMLPPRHVFARASDGSEFWSFGPYGLYRKHGSHWERTSLTPDSSIYYADPAFLIAAVSPGGKSPGAPEIYAVRENRFAVFAADGWTYSDPSRARIRSYRNLKVSIGGPLSDRIAIRSGAGLDIFDAGTGRLVPVDLGPEWGARSLASVFADREGGIWTTGRSGPGFLNAEEKKLLLPQDGRWCSIQYPAEFMAEDAAGTLWVVDSARLISMPEANADNRTWGIHPLPAAWGEGTEIKTVSAHPDGSIWAAVSLPVIPWTDRAARFDGKAWTLIDSLPDADFRYARIMDLRCDGAGNVWAMYPEGLWQWDGRAWKAHRPSSSPLLGNGPSAIGVDAQGTLWTATAAPGAGLLRWADGWQEAAPDATAKLGTCEVESMTRDGKGRLWLATRSDGLLVFDPAAEPARSAAPAGKPAKEAFSLRRRSDGAWLLDLADWPANGRLSARILDLRGRAIPGTRTRLAPTPQGAWLWPGPRPGLAPGRYLLSVESPGSTKALPFLFTGP